MSTTTYPSKAIPLPLAERPTGQEARYPRGTHTVKPFEQLPGLAQELVLSGGATLATTPLTQRPLTRQELESERKSLEREAATIANRLRQIAAELLDLPTAA
jgi:hypothetical protein